MAIFLALLALTATTVAVAYLDLGRLNTVVALVIAFAKALLVALFFMHLRYSSQLTKIVVAAGLAWLAILLGLTMQLLIIWVYLRWGTEGWRDTPLWPFGAGFVALFTPGLGLNARFDPDHPRAPARAWSRAVAVGIACAALIALIPA